MTLVKTVLSLFSYVTLVFFIIIYHKSGNSPRGPIGFPVVGYYFFTGKEPYKHFHRLASDYGPVFSVQLGSKNVIVLDDFQSNRDALSQDAFMGIPPESSFQFTSDTMASGAFHGLPWKEQRRFSIRMLKDLGFGKSHLEDMIKEEISELLVHLEAFDSHPSPLRPLLSSSVSNNVGSLLFGRRLPFDHPDRMMLDSAISNASVVAAQTAWQPYFPWLAKLLRSMKLGPDGEIAVIMKDFKEYARKQIAKHAQTLDPTSPRDYIDGYLIEIQKRNGSAFTKGVLEDMVFSFFSAGSESVRNTVEWLMLAMAAYPEVQSRVQHEIDEVLGPSRQPTWADHLLMPYTQATVFELMRWRTGTPLNFVRYTLGDTELNGLFIQKHSYVFSNLWSIHHNPEHWGPDADDFRPERFLEEDGKQVKKFEHFVPFSMGKRSCPGESFARTEIFLYFASLMQKFNVSLPAGSTPDLEGELGVGLSPKPQSLRFQPRI